MRRTLLAFLALASAIAMPVSAQDKVAVRDMANAAARADYACQRDNLAKCATEIDATAAALERARKPSGFVPTPTLEGGPRFLAPFDVNLGLATAPVPGPDTKGSFRFVCGGKGKIAAVDPILYPNQPDRSHLHQSWGSEDFTDATTPDSIRKEPRTSCNLTPYSLNRSLYWQPALLNDQGEVIQPNLVALYYKRWKIDGPSCTPGDARYVGICTGLPNQIRFIFGWNSLKPNDPYQGARWTCAGKTAGDLETLFALGCPVGSVLEAYTTAPQCWDGKYLDTPDHRSHMAYAFYDNKGHYQCPTTHPYTIPQQENKAQFTVTADMVTKTGKPRIFLASDHMLAGAKPGYTLHADYMEGWVWEAKRMWEDNCIAKGLNCSAGVLGNGKKLIGASQPAYGWVNPTPRVKLP